MARNAYSPATTRTFALVGHRSSGKTSLGDLLLQTGGVTRQVGRVDDGTSLLDHEPEERRRRQTLGPSFAWIEWEGRLLHLVDTPDNEALVHDTVLLMSGTDAVVVVVGGPDGVKVGTEQVLVEAKRMGLPRIVVVNKMDRTPDLDGLLEDLQAATGVRPVLLQQPLYDEEGRFSGLVDVLRGRVLRYDVEGGGGFSPEPIPEWRRDEVESARNDLAEVVALSDDDLLEHFLEHLELPPEVLARGLARAVRAGEVLPVLLTSAARCIGAHPLLDALTELVPSPLERTPPLARSEEAEEVQVPPDGGFVAQLLATRLDGSGQPYHLLRVWSGEVGRGSKLVDGATGDPVRVRKLYQVRGPRRATAFATFAGSIVATWDPIAARPGATLTDGPRLRLAVPPPPPGMMGWLLEVDGARHRRALDQALEVVLAMDRALELRSDELTGAPLLWGSSEAHLSRAVDLLRDRLGVAVRTRLPPVGYREIPAAAVGRVSGIHRRTSGEEVAEFGEVEITLQPTSPETRNRYDFEIPEEAIPIRFLSAIEQGLERAARHGPTAGYPVLGLRVRCTGGDYDILQSTEEHFVLAGERALRNALARSGSRLLEPWAELTITAPATEVGAVLSDVSANRGRILGLEVRSDEARIQATAPFREVRTFASRLQQITGGRGTFSWGIGHFEPLPDDLVREAVAASPFADLGARSEPVGTSTGVAAAKA